MNLWLTIIIAGVGTYATRVSFIAFGDRISLPEIVERGLRFVAPAAFAAISIPLVLGSDGFADFSNDIPRIVAATAAGVVVWKFKNLPASLVVGMGTLWLLLWLI